MKYSGRGARGAGRETARARLCVLVAFVAITAAAASPLPAPPRPEYPVRTTQRAGQLRSQGMSVRDAAAALVDEFGVRRNEAYRIVRDHE
jgi:hypothetical protein